MEKERSITPKLRKGEKMPLIPEGFVPTRVDGKIVFVLAKEPGEGYYHNSPYTARQINQIEGIRRNKFMQEERQSAVAEAEQIIYEHQMKQKQLYAVFESNSAV